MRQRSEDARGFERRGKRAQSASSPAGRFGKNEDRFAAPAWSQGETGVPFNADGKLNASAQVHEGGDLHHRREVVRAQFEPRRDPAYFAAVQPTTLR